MLNKIRTVFVLATAMVVLGAVGGTARAQEKLQGTWKVSSAAVGMNQLSGKQLRGWEVIVDGDKFTLVEGTKKESVHFSVNTDVTPNTIDFYKTSAKQEKVWHGIYKCCYATKKTSKSGQEGRE